MDPTAPFLANGRNHGNIVFNFRHSPVDDLVPFAMGYHAAGTALAKALATANGYHDYDGYPILFLYRHALELYLKAVIAKAAHLAPFVSEADEPPAIDWSRLWQEHSLEALLRPAVTVFKCLETVWPHSTEFISKLKPVIMEVYSLDPRSYTFRYPITTKGDAAHSHHSVLNVLIFAEKADAVCNTLETLCSGLSDEFQTTAEAKAAVRDFLAPFQSD